MTEPEAMALGRAYSMLQMTMGLRTQETAADLFILQAALSSTRPPGVGQVWIRCPHKAPVPQGAIVMPCWRLDRRFPASTDLRWATWVHTGGGGEPNVSMSHICWVVDDNTGLAAQDIGCRWLPYSVTDDGDGQPIGIQGVVGLADYLPSPQQRVRLVGTARRRRL